MRWSTVDRDDGWGYNAPSFVGIVNKTKQDERRNMQRVMKCLALTAAAVWGVWGTSDTSRAAEPARHKHVLVIGIDGCRTDALRAANTPNIDRLIDGGTVWYNAYAGGERHTKTEHTTISGPGWASILTGVWADKHGVCDNKFQNTHLKQPAEGKTIAYPTIFARIHEKHPEWYLASIVNWAPINQQIVQSDADCLDNGNDEQVAQKCVALLHSERDPALVFLQFDAVDGAGHKTGYGPTSPCYLKSIETVDRQVGDVLAALKKRAHYDAEDWLVLVTADHGGLGTKHGGQSPEERTVFIVANGGGYPRKVVDSPLGILAIADMTLRHLGIPIDDDWDLEKVSL